MRVFGFSASRIRGDRRAVRVRVALVLLGAATMLALGASSAAGLIVHLPGRTLSYSPVTAGAQRGARAPAKPDGSRPLEYHNGPVMTSNTNYTLYWDPAGAPEYGPGYQAGIDTWFEGLAHDSGGLQNTDSVLAQYHGKGGEVANYDSHFAGALLDTDPYPANGCSAAPICLTDEQLRAEIVRYVEAENLPMDLGHEYFLLTPEGVESCFEATGHECSAGASHAAYCSYHGFIRVGEGVIVYADIPYMEGTNCDTGEEHPNDSPSDATLGGGLVHEHSESVTDPELNAWFDAKGEEVADKCRTFKVATEFGEPLGKAPDGSNFNQVINGDEYWYQQEWSNETRACAQRLAALPAVTKLTPKKGPSAGGTAVTITGSGFAGTATVDFGGSAASEVTVESTTSIRAISPAGGKGTVDVTVTTSAGTSPVTKKDRFKYSK
ncbi:MAG: IPT/TIG domain-containing protein [Solirubrobacteraceae bacterium]